MTFTKTIERKYAESAHRRARELGATDSSLVGNEREYRECNEIWAALCEQLRHDGARQRAVAQVTPGVWVETAL